jgi:ribosomal protein L37AE/L43A
LDELAGYFIVRGTVMAEKKAKTAESRGAEARKHACPSCSAETRVIYYTGFGKKGFFWVCDKNCGYSARTR